MSRLTTIASALVVVVAVACSKSRPNADSVAGAVLPADTHAAAATPVAPPPPAPFALAVATKEGTTILTDATGKALYMADAMPKCDSVACAKFMVVRGTATSGDPKIKAALIGTKTLPDGGTAVTYGGHELYTYDGDMAAGDTKGQGEKANGTTYHLVNPEGKKVAKVMKKTT